MTPNSHLINGCVTIIIVIKWKPSAKIFALPESSPVLPFSVVSYALAYPFYSSVHSTELLMSALPIYNYWLWHHTTHWLSFGLALAVGICIIFTCISKVLISLCPITVSEQEIGEIRWPLRNYLSWEALSGRQGAGARFRTVMHKLRNNDDAHTCKSRRTKYGVWFSFLMKYNADSLVV